MTPRAPYSMVTLANEVVALDDALVEYQNPDGLHIYLELRITSDQHARMLGALKQVRKFDTRLTEVRDEGDHIIVRITPAGGRWTRDPFHLDAMWETTTAKKTAAKKTTKRAPVKKDPPGSVQRSKTAAKKTTRKKT